MILKLGSQTWRTCDKTIQEQESLNLVVSEVENNERPYKEDEKRKCIVKAV